MLVFDGELYQKNDDISDSHYILNSYLEHGIDNMFNYLRGTWAMCIVDLRISKVYIVRDKMGEKPCFLAYF